MSDLKVALIVGSTRPGSVGGKVGKWYVDQAKSVKGIEIDVIDLNEEKLPFLNEPMPPAMGQYTHEHTKKWSEKIASYDAYVWITAEYNHSIPAALKNAIDYLFIEWANKPVALVSYGSMGGVRAAEHLRQVAGELQMADIRSTVMIRNPWAMLDENGEINPELVLGDVSDQLEQLKWWGDALKTARNTQ
jgi:NAD(P)H-dependent FMN reductase